MAEPSSIVRSVAAELYDANVLGNYARPAVTLVRGRGTTVWDDQGRAYLDFSSGIAVTSLGHSHPRWVEAVQRQAAELVHVSNLFRNPNQGELARKLVGYAGPGRVFFCNSGGEADEALIKLSRLHGFRKGGVEGKCIRVVAAKGGFHGRMFGGMSATPKESVQKGFRPLLPGFVFGDLNDLASFERLVDDDTSSILVETVQGDGGINPCTPQFLQGLRRLCDERNLLLLADEVQCGAGRTGRFFAFEHAGIRPDAIAMAKGLAGGFPIGAVWVAEKAADLFQPGMHGSTFGGTPLACAAALAVLGAIESEGLLGHVSRESAPWIRELRRMAAEQPAKVADVRGLGFLVGVQMTSDNGPVVAALREKGLLTAPAANNVVRLLPPLNATAEELGRSVAIFREVLGA
ncbi:MAG TPA: acetylornithine/succinylornithine family transaminase [Opitutaceae bacterium]|jgi:acetylornithine aminotransferase/acetylornithine/N-succinyldiaminopimelate aminotransferase